MIDFSAAERSTVGCILIDPSVLPAVRTIVSPGDFAVEELKTLYSAACALAAAPWLPLLSGSCHCRAQPDSND